MSHLTVQRTAPLGPRPLSGATPTVGQERPRSRSTRPRLNVAVALGGTDLGKSGIGTYVREVLPPLIAQMRAEDGRVTAFGHPSELDAFASQLKGAQQVAVPVAASKPGLNALWYLTRAGDFARRLGASVLLLPAANRRVIARSPLPSVAVVHDLAQLRVAQKYDALRMFYFRHVLLRAFRVPTRVVAVSGATRDDLLRTVRLPETRVRIVYNGVNTRVFKNLDASSERVRQARFAVGLDQSPYLLYPARLEHPGKNHVRLLRAFAQSGLADSHVLALPGGDWGAGELIASTIRELRLEHSVKVLGFVSNDLLPALVAGADAVLMLGLHEGFGLPALEGLCAGRAVCVSNTGALPEVVGDLGVKCNPFDEDAIACALTRVVTDEVLRARCQLEGPSWADRFTWEQTARGLLDACHDASQLATCPRKSVI